MSPRELDPAVVQERLRHVRRLVRQLQAHRDIDGDMLRESDVVRGAVLWALTQLVSVAASTNAHLVSAGTGHAPGSLRESFELAVETGAIRRDDLDSYRAATGLRNALVHEYAEIDLDVVAASVPLAVGLFDRYVTDVARFLTTPA